MDELRAGQRVRLAPDEYNPEEFGTVLEVGRNYVAVQLDPQYIDPECFDDGIRELALDLVEVVK